MKRALVAIALMTAFVSLQMSTATATTPTPCPSPSAASDGRVTCTAAQVDPNQAAYDLLKTRLGGDIAKALAAEQQLSAVLDQFSATELLLNSEVAREEALIARLEEEIAKLDAQIADTEARIEVEKQQLASMSRAIYRQPDSFWLLIARSGNLREALVATADAVVAGQRAHALQTRLEADLAKLQSDRQAKQADLDRENTTLDLLNANLDSLQEVMRRQSDVSDQLASLIAQIQAAQEHLANQAPEVTAALTQLLEAQEQDLILRSYPFHDHPGFRSIQRPPRAALRPVQALPYGHRPRGPAGDAGHGRRRRPRGRRRPFVNGIWNLRRDRARRRHRDALRAPAADERQRRRSCRARSADRTRRIDGSLDRAARPFRAEGQRPRH